MNIQILADKNQSIKKEKKERKLNLPKQKELESFL